MTTRDYDIVVWGATAFTGRLACKHLAEHAPRTLRWAVAGRREGALNEIKESLASAPCPPMAIEVADASDKDGASRIASRASLVLAIAR